MIEMTMATKIMMTTLYLHTLFSSYIHFRRRVAEKRPMIKDLGLGKGIPITIMANFSIFSVSLMIFIWR